MCLMFSCVFGQQESEDDGGTSDKPLRAYWEANIKEGNYTVHLNNVVSISYQTYSLDGVAIVDEVIIDTRGQSLVRFYYLEPIVEPNKSKKPVDHLTKPISELADHAKKRTNEDIKGMVMKDYPMTTHAKTVEYRLKSKKSLQSLHGSIVRTWLYGKHSYFTEE